MLIREHNGKIVRCSEGIAPIFRAILNTLDELDREKEHFYTICLDAKNKIKLVDLVSVGSLSASIVHPRETFRRAIIEGAASIILGHNHPSGDPTPSKEDIALTQRLQQAGEILAVKVLDHIIIGGDNHVSLAEMGYLK